MLDHSPSAGGAEAAQPASAEARARRSALLIVFLVVVIDLLGFGIVLPLLPRYGKDFLEPLYPGPEQAEVRGAILGALMASFSLMQFLLAPLWGRLSDRVGRRPILLLGLAGSVAFYTLFGIASDQGTTAPALGLTLLFVARVGAGVAGATLGTAQAVIADSTSQENRKRGMALIGAAFGIGFTFGPILGAASLYFLPEHRGAPGYAAAGFSLLALVLGVVLLPETWRPGGPGGRRHWLNVSGLRLALQTPTVGLLMLTFFCSTLAFANFEPTLALLTQDVLGYGDRENFLVFSYVGLVLMLAQGGLYQVLARRGVQEISFMLMGTVLMGLGLGALGVEAAWATGAEGERSAGLLPGFLAAVTVAVVGFAFVVPSVQSLISRRSDPTRQGEILGVNQSLNALARILGPMAGMSLYAMTPAHTGPYVFAAVLLCVALLLTVQVRRP